MIEIAVTREHPYSLAATARTVLPILASDPYCSIPLTRPPDPYFDGFTPTFPPKVGRRDAAPARLDNSSPAIFWRPPFDSSFCPSILQTPPALHCPHRCLPSSSQLCCFSSPQYFPSFPLLTTLLCHHSYPVYKILLVNTIDRDN